MENVTWLPTLVKVGKKKDLRYTRIGYRDNILVTHTYKQGCSGKYTEKAITSSGKEGTKSYLTPEEHAITTATSKWERSVKDGLVQEHELDPTGFIFPISPMKLMTIITDSSDKKNNSVHIDNVPNKLYCQRKYDGGHGIASYKNDEVVLYSSGRSPVTNADHIKIELKPILDLLRKGKSNCDIHLVGEVYNHKVKRNQLQSWIKNMKNVSVDANNMEYYIYDIIDNTETTTWETRYKLLKALAKKFSNLQSIKFVETYLIDKSEIKKYHDQFVSEGYEGAIIRIPDGVYLRGIKIRSKDVLKYKEFYEGEFKIVGAHDGEGKCQGQIIFELVTEDGIPFNSTPSMDEDERRKLWNIYQSNPDSLIGRMATVRYFSMNMYKKPEFSNLICIRGHNDS